MSRTSTVILILALVAGPARTFQTQPQAPGTAAVSGVVTDAATKRPIAGAIAVLRNLGTTSRSTSQQATDALGRFVFDQLPASKTYILSVSRPGYVEGSYGQLRGQSGSPRFTLADDQWLSTADVALTKVGAIGGIVSDEFGEPIVGAFVRAIVEVTVAGRRQLAAGPVTKTDDRGEYRLTGLLPARYFLMVPSIQHSVPATATPAEIEGLRDDMYERLQTSLARNPSTRRFNNGAVSDGATRLIIGNFVTPPAPIDGRARAYPMTFLPGTTSIASAAIVDLTGGGDRSGVNISLQPVSAVRVSGRLEGMTRPARLTLRLVPAGLETLATGEAATTIANADGTFTFLSVPPGAYTLDPRQLLFEFTVDSEYIPGSPGLPPTPGRQLLGGQFVGPITDGSIDAGYKIRYTPGDTYFGSTLVNVGSTDVSNVVVAMQPGLTIRGRFVYEDLTSAPPQHATVMFAEPADAKWELGVGASWNEDEGSNPASFAIHGLMPGAYLLRPTPPAATVVKSIVVNGQDSLRQPFDVAPGRDLDIVVTFTGKIPTLSGSARNADGTAAARRPLIVFSTDRRTWRSLGLSPMLAKFAMTSAEGTFTITTLPAGEYFVIALDAPDAAGWTDPAFLEKAAAVATRVLLEPGAVRSVALTAVTVKR